MKKHISNLKFWYAIGTVKQTAFNHDGSTYMVDVDGIVVGEGHIIHNDVLLCRKSRDAIKKQHNTKRQSTVESRKSGVPLCKVCEQKFKENTDFAWQRWTKNVKV